ncbi:MAG: hypothetical protein WBN28_12315 [Lutimonas sp.]
MAKLRFFQRMTLLAWGLYLVWEVLVWQWAKGLAPSDPVIRADLFIIYPILGILSAISLWQFFTYKI